MLQILIQRVHHGSPRGKVQGQGRVGRRRTLDKAPHRRPHRLPALAPVEPVLFDLHDHLREGGLSLLRERGDGDGGGGGGGRAEGAG